MAPFLLYLFGDFTCFFFFTHDESGKTFHCYLLFTMNDLNCFLMHEFFFSRQESTVCLIHNYYNHIILCVYRVNIQVYMLQIVISTCKLSVFMQLKLLFAVHVPIMSQARHFIAILLFISTSRYIVVMKTLLS